MPMRVQIHGGPHDGEYVDFMGQYMRMPVPTPATVYFAVDAIPTLSDLPRIDEYVLHRGFDGEMYYVRRPG